MFVLLLVALSILTTGLLGSLIGAIGGLFGGGSGKKLSKEERKLLTTLMEFAKRYEQQFQQRAGQLDTFFDPYLLEGSPFLGRIQRAGAERIAREFDQAGARLSQRLAQSGFGTAPSGLQAAALGDLGRARAASAAETYLSNLLANEQLKFSAAGAKQGIMPLFSPAQFLGQAANVASSGAVVPGLATNILAGAAAGRDLFEGVKLPKWLGG